MPGSFHSKKRFVPFKENWRKSTGTTRARTERERQDDHVHASAREFSRQALRQNLKASTTAQHHVHAHPAVGITSTEPGRKARPCKPGGRARPRVIFETKTKTQTHYKEETPTRLRTVNTWFAIIAVPKRIVQEVCAARSIAWRARRQDIDRNQAHARSASVANARQSDIRHASVDHRRSWYALTVALKRIVPEAGTAQSTARCAKHPVMDRSLARARSASVASANKSDTRLENAKSRATAPLRVMSMGAILWMLLTIKMPTPAR